MPWPAPPRPVHRLIFLPENPTQPSPRAQSPGVGTRPAKGWHIALWVVQVLLGAAFVVGGLMKAIMPVADLAQNAAWTADVPLALLRFIGVAELAGGLGLILPAATRIRPMLTPLAAVGLATIMTLAFVFHIQRGEWDALPVNAVLGALAAFVAWGRVRKAPIAPR
jgi:putative oxidoreductase